MFYRNVRVEYCTGGGVVFFYWTRVVHTRSGCPIMNWCIVGGIIDTFNSGNVWQLGLRQFLHRRKVWVFVWTMRAKMEEMAGMEGVDGPFCRNRRLEWC